MCLCLSYYVLFVCFLFYQAEAAAAVDESRTRAHMNVNVDMKACNIFRLELFSPSMITVINHEHLMRKSWMFHVYHNKRKKIGHEKWPIECIMVQILRAKRHFIGHKYLAFFGSPIRIGTYSKSTFYLNHLTQQ